MYLKQAFYVLYKITWHQKHQRQIARAGKLRYNRPISYKDYNCNIFWELITFLRHRYGLQFLASSIATTMAIFPTVTIGMIDLMISSGRITAIAAMLDWIWPCCRLLAVLALSAAPVRQHKSDLYHIWRYVFDGSNVFVRMLKSSVVVWYYMESTRCPSAGTTLYIAYMCTGCSIMIAPLHSRNQ